jgi:transposase
MDSGCDSQMGGIQMNSVGIDISKGRSTIAVMRPFGEVVISPFEVRHTDSELSELARQLKSLDGETRVVMETTGNYHAPVAKLLHDAGLYVSVVNAKLVHGYGNNDLRRVKTDKKDAVKLANYGLDRWLTLPRYVPEEDTRLLLKNCYRQYRQYSKVQTVLKNNLISLLDTVFPNANRLFSSPIRGDGSEKWVDFVAEFWHCRCVSEKSQGAFTNNYQRWCRKHGYNFNEAKAHTIHAEASGHIGVMPKSETTKLLVEQAVAQLRATSAALIALKREMLTLAAQLPEYPVVMGMFGVGPTLGPQLIAEIGDVRRFYSKKALVAYAGLDAPPNDSGDVSGKHKSMSKIGSSALRRTLFLVMSVYLQNAPLDEPVYQFMGRKCAEGKPYRVYMMASANKFLRIYYASVKAYLESLEQV